MRVSNIRPSVPSRSKDDVLERFFSWSEAAICPYIVPRDAKLEDAPVMDYVFENVESFVCAEQAPHMLLEDAETSSLVGGDDGYHPHRLERDNSLVEVGPNGHSGVPSVTRRGGNQRGRGGVQTRTKIQPLGSEGDILDYVFEKTESYTCGPEGPSGRVISVPATKSNRSGRKSDGKHRKMPRKPTRSYKMEDEVQLYFRPNRH